MRTSRWQHHAARLRWVIGTTVAVVALAACSGGSDGAVDTPVLTMDQARDALLTVENLGPGYEVSEDDDDDDQDPPVGCLVAIDEFDENDADVDVDAQFGFQPESTLGVPTVTTGVLGFGSTAAAEAFMADYTAAFDGCATVDERADNGVEVKLDVGRDDHVFPGVAADEQLNVRGTGSFSHQDTGVKFTVVMAVVRSGANVVAVLVSDLAGLDAVEPLAVEYTRLALERLEAVSAGNEPPDETASVSPEPQTPPPAAA